jgi:hypothetical protein
MNEMKKKKICTRKYHTDICNKRDLTYRNKENQKKKKKKKKTPRRLLSLVKPLLPLSRVSRVGMSSRLELWSFVFPPSSPPLSRSTARRLKHVITPYDGDGDSDGDDADET